MQRTLALVALFLVFTAPFTLAGNTQTLNARFARVLDDDVESSIFGAIGEDIFGSNDSDDPSVFGTLTGNIGDALSGDDCEGTMVGCFEEVTDEELDAFKADYDWLGIIQSVLDAGASDFGFGLSFDGAWTIEELDSVETQVVNGINYRITADLIYNGEGELEDEYTFVVNVPADDLTYPSLESMAEASSVWDGVGDAFENRYGDDIKDYALETGKEYLNDALAPDGSDMTDYVGYLLTIYPDLALQGLVPAGTPEVSYYDGQLTIDGLSATDWLATLEVYTMADLLELLPGLEADMFLGSEGSVRAGIPVMGADGNWYWNEEGTWDDFDYGAMNSATNQDYWTYGRDGDDATDFVGNLEDDLIDQYDLDEDYFAGNTSFVCLSTMVVAFLGLKA